jgi:hypothetical protein
MHFCSSISCKILISKAFRMHLTISLKPIRISSCKTYNYKHSKINSLKLPGNMMLWSSKQKAKKIHSNKTNLKIIKKLYSRDVIRLSIKLVWKHCKLYFGMKNGKNMHRNRTDIATKHQANKIHHQIYKNFQVFKWKMIIRYLNIISLNNIMMLLIINLC